MYAKGLDYNTQRPLLKQPEYGREIQKMVDYAVTITDKEERQACAHEIVRLMAAKAPHIRENENYEQMLWDHLYIMSGKALDIDWPFDVSNAEKISVKPEPMPLTKSKDRVHIRHYGRLLEKMFEELKTMPEGPQRDELARITANQMRLNLLSWGHGSAEEERVIDDLAYFTDGVIQLDPENFVFGRIPVSDGRESKRRKK